MADETLDISKIERPPLEFTFTDSSKAPIKMTYGLEMDIRRLLPDPRTAMQLALYDTFTQDYVVRRCLTNKKKVITDPEELIPFEEVDLDSDEIERLLKWALEHALYFFVKRTTEVGELGVRFRSILPQDQTKPSTNGSEISTSTTPSAGDSESSKDNSTKSSGPSPDEKSSNDSA